MDYGKEIAKASLDIQSINLRPEKPFTWASGYRMPIYNDNRMLLGNYEHRMLVKNGLVELIENSGEKPEFILGTSTAGIAPAAMVADKLNLPLVIFNEGKPYGFTNSPFKIKEEYDAIASTCPWAIPYGVNLANEKKLPFMYVRQNAKAHGMEQQIEGIPLHDKNVLLLDIYSSNDQSYGYNAKKVLNQKDMGVDTLFKKFSSFISSDINIKGKKGIVIEDLISTGGSSAKEVKAARDFGANVNYCFSIFGYGLLEAQNEFDKYAPNTIVNSVLTYPKLLETAKEIGYLDNNQIKLLEDWRADPFNWGEKHGFPKVEKNN